MQPYQDQPNEGRHSYLQPDGPAQDIQLLPQHSLFSLKPRPRLEASHRTAHRQIQITDHAAPGPPYLSDFATRDMLNG